MTPECEYTARRSKSINVSRTALVLPVRTWRWIELQDIRGGQAGHEQEKKKIRWDVQVEIDETVHEKATASHQAREL